MGDTYRKPRLLQEMVCLIQQVVLLNWCASMVLGDSPVLK